MRSMRRIAFSLAFASTLAGGAASAEDAALGSEFGRPLTQSEFRTLVGPAQVAPWRTDGMVRHILEVRATVEVARAAGGLDEAAVRLRSAFVADQVRASAYLDKVAAAAVTPEKVAAAYEALKAARAAATDTRFSQVAFKAKGEADAFAGEVRKAPPASKSLDEAAKAAGLHAYDSAFLQESRVLSAVRTASAAIPEGGVFGPVQIGQSYLVGMVVERRKGSAPPLAQAESGIRRQIMEEARGAELRRIDAQAGLVVAVSAKPPAAVPAPAGFPEVGAKP